MRKLINNANEFVDEATEGILMAHPRSLRWAAENRRAVVRASAGTDGKVGIVTGGGSGHLPLFLGYVGEGLASGVAIGNVFSSPSPEAIYAATKASDTGRGVLYLYGNYGGDIYNFDIAAEMAAADGIDTTTVRGHDDILSASETDAEKRRGVAGLFFLYKVSGAAADAGYDLATVKRLTLRASKNTATVGVGLSPTILPAAGEPTFHLEDGQMEIGIGIHGEKGRYKGELRSADSITEELLSELVDGLALVEADEVAILVNGLGATPLEELYIMYRKASAMLHERSINLSRVYVGNFATSLEMTGASISLLKLDHELRDLLDTPCFITVLPSNGTASM
jgi:dihydroxyacetone kinase